MDCHCRRWRPTLHAVILSGAVALAGCAMAAPARTEQNADAAPARVSVAGSGDLRSRYSKREYYIPMRDGVRLFTAVYTPKDLSKPYPFLMMRTPYGIQPYGEERYPRELGPSPFCADDGFIFVYQDVRGRFMSEGRFVNMTPHIENKQTRSNIDESTDTYDTIEWLLDNTDNHNGRVGMWGISYPGFYAAAGMINAHPALKAVSPQAPIGDWYFDDFHHHGAFFLADAFNFFAVFGRPRPEPTKSWGKRFDHGTPDGYQFFLDLGPLRHANERHFHGEIDFWNKLVAHPDYDAFWQSRNIVPHLYDTAPAVMVVVGLFDAEDLYGPLHIYQSIEDKNPASVNMLVLGPWSHGGWARTKGDRLGDIRFGALNSKHYQENIELPFFKHYLKAGCEVDFPEAYVFETGKNRWHTFDQWPPTETRPADLYVGAGGRLAFEPAGSPAIDSKPYDEFVSDPAKPVPFIDAITVRTPKRFMTSDQRFAARRPDVLAYQTDPLAEAVTLAGPMIADLWVSTSGTDADWVVKVIDVYPPDEPDPDDMPPGRHMGGYQMMVRSEVIRGRYRNSYEVPEPFEPNEPTRVMVELQDVLHTFHAGHRIMVQVQSSWFPLVDRNPQSYVDNIFLAREQDFIKATHRVYHAPGRQTRLRVGVLEAACDEDGQTPGD